MSAYNTITVGNKPGNPQSPASTAIDVPHGGRQKETCWRKIVNWFQDKDKSKWLKNMRGMLSVASTMIAAICFQSSINPPGGVFQADYKSYKNCTSDTSLCTGAGIAVMAVLKKRGFYLFELFNTICFVSSLSVTLLLVSGVPLNHRFPMWILSLGMIVTLTFLALTYLFSLTLISPPDDRSFDDIFKITGGSLLVWFALVAIVTSFLTIRFLVWFVKSIKAFKRRK